MKIVISKSYGGFWVSEAFLKHYKIPYKLDELFKQPRPKENITRTDRRLIKYIETYGSEAASGKFSNLVVKTIPAGTAYRICNYDSYEYIEYRDEIKWEIAED
jgi:hypothetical protein